MRRGDVKSEDTSDMKLRSREEEAFMLTVVVVQARREGSLEAMLVRDVVDRLPREHDGVGSLQGPKGSSDYLILSCS